MTEKAISEGYSSSVVCAAVGVPRTTFDAWVLRGYLPLSPGPGTGRARALTFLDAVRLAAVAQLTRLGVAVSVAGHAAARIEMGMLSPSRKNERTALVLMPGRLQTVIFKRLNDLEKHLVSRVADFQAVAMVDVTTLAQCLGDRLSRS